MTLPFALAPVNAEDGSPRWDGKLFHIGTNTSEILQYSINETGWNDDLTSMHEEAASDHHFIDRASRQHAISELTRHLKTPHPVILEVGCSSGFMLQKINETFPEAVIIGADVTTEPLQKLAKKLPHIPLMRFDMMQCPLPDNSFDAIVMLNVLEHIEHDNIALKHAYRILKPGGIIVLEVPAGPHLYDAYDKVLMHYRRYTLPGLIKTMNAAGFNIKNKSHLGFFLYPGFWLVKQKNKKLLTESAVRQREKIQEVIQQSRKNRIMHAIMQFELFAGNTISYPAGIRCLVTGTKPKI